MREAATNLEFEKAARLRDELKRLREMEVDTLDSAPQRHDVTRHQRLDDRALLGSLGQSARERRAFSRTARLKIYHSRTV